MTLNWILSLKKININRFLIICLDQDLFNFFAHKGFIDNLLLVPDDWHDYEVTKYFTVWKTREHIELNQARIQIIHKLLKLNVTLLLADVDIVWLNENFLEHVQYIFKQTSADVLFSISEIKLRKVWYCIGFYYIKPSPFTIELMLDLLDFQHENPQRTVEQNLNAMVDQLQKYKNTDKIGALDPILFPSGNVWVEKKLNEKFQLTPYILHANFLIGKQSKIDAFKKQNLWFLDEKCSTNSKKTD